MTKMEEVGAGLKNECDDKDSLEENQCQAFDIKRVIVENLCYLLINVSKGSSQSITDSMAARFDPDLCSGCC